MIEQVGAIIVKYHFPIGMLLIGFFVWVIVWSEEKHIQKQREEAMAREADKYEPENEDSLGV
jgi:hypothetical protein